MPNPPPRISDSAGQGTIFSRMQEVVLFSSTAIALYGYDQGMMSLVNTNRSYLRTMGIAGDSPIVGIIVSVYYLGCAVGAVIASFWADKRGRKPSIFTCLATTAIGNILMFVSGMTFNGSGSKSSNGGALACILTGRVIMGLGVGGIDAIVPIYSSELSTDEARGRALAQEFQMNIFGLLIAYSINLGITMALGKDNQWAWRVPIVVMQVFPLVLMSIINTLPETPRWFMSQDRKDDAMASLKHMCGEEEANFKFEEIDKAQREETGKKVGYKDMLLPGRSQFHPTMVTIMGQVNQALTGYGAVSVYGPQIFELLGFSVREAEFLTLGNYTSYFLIMTVAWMTIDVMGRRKLMIWGAAGLATSFALLTIFGGLATVYPQVPDLAAEIPGTIILFVATAIFGIGWLATVWLIPTEIYPNTARAQGSAISVIIWGLANFAVTLLSPIGFNNLKYGLFLIFAATNAFAGWWTWTYTPETGARTFEENQEFFNAAAKDGSWVVRKVAAGKYSRMPPNKDRTKTHDEETPLLRRSASTESG